MRLARKAAHPHRWFDVDPILLLLCCITVLAACYFMVPEEDDGQTERDHDAGRHIRLRHIGCRKCYP